LKNVAIYYRVSTDKQDLDSQVQTVEKWIDELHENKKPAKIHVFKDEGISGKTLNRPGFQDMMKLAYERRIDTIIVYRLDRFSRDATTAIKTILNLDEVGVGFISVTQPVLNLGHENPFRRTMLSAFAEIAEIERETIVTRVRAGLEAAKKRGVKLGAPIKIDDQKIARALTLRGQGRTFREIATELELSVGAVHKLIKSANDQTGVLPSNSD
jgi:DNA invertase Pin-like site-specific DNA recombinase